MRIVAWNVRAGGGRRVDAIRRQLRRWAPDLVALSEFRATPPSRALAAGLAADGLAHQLTTAARAAPERNALLVAAVDAPRPLVLGAMHVPNRASGRKYGFLRAVLACARRWRLGPAVFVGDTNSGRRGIDEEAPAFNAQEEGWIDALDDCGWRDAFRHLRADARAYTWYSPNGRNGFRIDQAFVNRALLGRLAAATYAWGGAAGRRRAALSDHAALLIDLADP